MKSFFITVAAAVVGVAIVMVAMHFMSKSGETKPSTTETK